MASGGLLFYCVLIKKDTSDIGHCSIHTTVTSKWIKWKLFFHHRKKSWRGERIINDLFNMNMKVLWCKTFVCLPNIRRVDKFAFKFCQLWSKSFHLQYWSHPPKPQTEKQIQNSSFVSLTEWKNWNRVYRSWIIIDRSCQIAWEQKLYSGCSQITWGIRHKAHFEIF